MLVFLALAGCAAAPDDPCPWTTSAGKKSCGARPPAKVDKPRVERMVVDEPMHVETAGERLLAWSNMAIDFTDRMPQLRLRADLAHASRFDLLLGTDGLANAFVFTLRSGQGQPWIVDATPFTVSFAPNAVLGNPDRARITDIALRVVDDGTPVTIDLAGIAVVPEPVARYPRGVLTFTFDDNHDTMITEAAPRLDARGFAATAYVIVDQVDLAARATLAQLADRQARGWDIAVHAYSSYAHEERWPTIPAAALEDDLVEARAWLMANGFSGYDHCAYPGGDFTLGGTTDVLAIVERYFTTCRSIYQRQREAYPPSDARKLRVLYITNTTTLDAAKRAVDNAIAAREWIIVVFHRLVDTPSLSTEWAKSDFAAFVDHVAASRIPVETVTRVLD